LLQGLLLPLVERRFTVRCKGRRLRDRAIWWIEIDKVSGLGLVKKMAEISANHICTAENPGALPQPILIRNAGIFITTERNVEFSSLIDPEKSVVASLIEVDQTGSSLDGFELPRLHLAGPKKMVFTIRMLPQRRY